MIYILATHIQVILIAHLGAFYNIVLFTSKP